ncbi:MAG TPA: hypothetical protein VGH49_10545 [Xanthobacteraceae bacterium]
MSDKYEMHADRADEFAGRKLCPICALGSLLAVGTLAAIAAVMWISAQSYFEWLSHRSVSSLGDLVVNLFLLLVVYPVLILSPFLVVIAAAAVAIRRAAEFAAALRLVADRMMARRRA